MVTRIHEPRTSFNETIYYMERKVSMGNGELLYKTLNEEKPSLFYKEMNEVANQNDKVINKCLHFSLNLPVGENLTHDQFTKLGKNYLEKMGYSDCPHLIYIHNDKKHSHIHLIVSSVDYNGSWINDSFSHMKSFNISRTLEKEFNLTKLETNTISEKQTKHFSIKEKAMLDNSFRNGLRRALFDKKGKNYLTHHLSENEIKLILKEADNKTCKFILGDRFDYLNDFLMEKGYCTKHIKDKLLTILDEANKKTSKDEFFKHLEENNVSTSVFSYKGKTKYTFYISDYDYKFNENRLPKNYTYNNISERFGSFTGTFIPESEQKHIIYNIFRSSLQSSSSINDLFDKLDKSNIKFSFSYDNHTTNINVSLKDVNNSKIFNSEIIYSPFSYLSLNEYFNNRTSISSLFDQTIKDIVTLHETNYSHYIPIIPISSATSGSPHDDDSWLNRKKKKKKTINLEQSNG